jgi:hypothetical protein
MDKKQKKELLVAICGYLPYGIVCDRPSGNSVITKIYFDKEYNDWVAYNEEGLGGSITFEKPYLRPMSSMTEDEVLNLYKMFGFYYLQDLHELTDEWRHFKGAIEENKLFLPYPIWADDLEKGYDYLRSIHIDYCNLIDKGLALPATDGMYK